MRKSEVVSAWERTTFGRKTGCLRFCVGCRFWRVFLFVHCEKDRNTVAGKPLVTVRDVALDHWRRFGRHYYTRYDYEGLETQQAQMVMARLLDIVAKFDGKTPRTVGKVALVRMDEFEYHDPIDGSVSAHQGIRFFSEDGSRIVFRLSGTGSAGATIRMYLEKYEKDPTKLELRTAVGLEGRRES